MFQKFRVALFTFLAFVTPAIADGVEACKPKGSTPLCTPATPGSRYVIDLRDYRGVFGVDPQSLQHGAVGQRFACPSTGRCVCELTTNVDPTGDWFLVFSGRYSIAKPSVVPIRFDGGRLTMRPSFLGANISLRRNKIALAPGAFRKAVFERDGKPGDWSLENWDCVSQEFARLPPNGKLAVKLIVNVENNATMNGHSIEALTADDSPAGFSLPVPSYLELDPALRRAVRLKRKRP